MSLSDPRPPAPEYVPSIDALRGLLALCVAMYHFSGWTHVFGRGTALSSTVAALGIYSVEGFFIISGFCFFHLYGETGVTRAGLRGFYIKRFLRLAPLYYLALALNVVLGREVGAMTLPRVIENLTLTFGLFHPNHARVLGGWSIGIEVVFYLAFPLLAWLTRRRWALLSTTALLVLWACLHATQPVPTASIWLRFNQYVELPNHAFLFLLGGVLAERRRRTAVRFSTLPMLVLLVGVGLWAIQNEQPFQDHYDVMHGLLRVRYLLACFFVAWLFAFHRAEASVFEKPLRWLGDHSYSVYLLHPFASFAVTSVLSPQASPVTAFGLGMLVTLGFAALGRHWIEAPAIAWGKRLAR